MGPPGSLALRCSSERVAVGDRPRAVPLGLLETTGRAARCNWVGRSAAEVGGRIGDTGLITPTSAARSGPDLYSCGHGRHRALPVAAPRGATGEEGFRRTSSVRSSRSIRQLGRSSNTGDTAFAAFPVLRGRPPAWPTQHGEWVAALIGEDELASPYAGRDARYETMDRARDFARRPRRDRRPCRGDPRPAGHEAALASGDACRIGDRSRRTTVPVSIPAVPASAA